MKSSTSRLLSRIFDPKTFRLAYEKSPVFLSSIDDVTASAIIALLSVIGAIGGNFLLIVFWLDEKININNERTDKVYEIIVNQEKRISSNESAIDIFIKEHAKADESR